LLTDAPAAKPNFLVKSSAFYASVASPPPLVKKINGICTEPILSKAIFFYSAFTMAVELPNMILPL